MEMLAIHSYLTRSCTDVSVMARQKPRNVVPLELRFKHRSRLTVAERGIELRGNWL